MRAEALVDLSAIKANIKLLKEKAGVDVLAVVKADAYGHGLVPVAKAALRPSSAPMAAALSRKAARLSAL